MPISRQRRQQVVTGVKEFTSAGNFAFTNEVVCEVNKGNNAAGPTTVTLPPSPLNARTVEIVDKRGDAGTNNITIVGANNATIDGAAQQVITQNYGKLACMYNGNQWQVVSRSGQYPQSQYTASTQANATVAAGTLTGADFVVAAFTANGTNSLTTRTAAQMFADLPDGRPGKSYTLRVCSQGNNTVTLNAGNGVTISGTPTIATTVFRDYVVTFPTANTCTIQNTGSGVSP